MKFQISDKVFKPKGYKFEGEIRSVFTNKAGEVRVVAELEGGLGAGILHIYNEQQLEKK